MNEDDITSKTQRKNAMHELQALGEELITLSNQKLAKLNLPENLLQAIVEAKRIIKHGALKRQRQYIGKLMRSIDADPIRETLAGWKNQSGAVVAIQHTAERWRDKLIEDEHQFTAFIEEYPSADVSRLRQLARNAKDEKAKNKPPKSYRELYRAILESINSSKSENTNEDEEEGEEND